MFIDGNHENFDRLLTEYPDTVRWGAPARRIGKNIYWLRRGQIYTIEERTFFCMGGAYSMDKYLRTPGVNWWPQELPGNDDYHTAIQNLQNHDMRVDYVLTHTAPQSLILRMGSAPDRHDAELTGFLDWVWHDAAFRQWYFGHWHRDARITDRAAAVYMDVIAV